MANFVGLAVGSDMVVYSREAFEYKEGLIRTASQSAKAALDEIGRALDLLINHPETGGSLPSGNGTVAGRARTSKQLIDAGIDSIVRLYKAMVQAKYDMDSVTKFFPGVLRFLGNVIDLAYKKPVVQSGREFDADQNAILMLHDDGIIDTANSFGEFFSAVWDNFSDVFSIGDLKEITGSGFLK